MPRFLVLDDDVDDGWTSFAWVGSVGDRLASAATEVSDSLLRGSCARVLSELDSTFDASVACPSSVVHRFGTTTASHEAVNSTTDLPFSAAAAAKDALYQFVHRFVARCRPNTPRSFEDSSEDAETRPESEANEWSQGDACSGEWSPPTVVDFVSSASDRWEAVALAWLVCLVLICLTATTLRARRVYKSEYERYKKVL